MIRLSTKDSIMDLTCFHSWVAIFLYGRSLEVISFCGISKNFAVWILPFFLKLINVLFCPAGEIVVYVGLTASKVVVRKIPDLLLTSTAGKGAGRNS